MNIDLREANVVNDKILRDKLRKFGLHMLARKPKQKKGRPDSQMKRDAEKADYRHKRMGVGD